MQLGSRLEPFGVRSVALDFPGAPDGIGRSTRPVQAFGPPVPRASWATSSASRTTASACRRARSLKPRSSRAIPEILDVKRAHYQVFRDTFPGIAIRSVTSGPSKSWAWASRTGVSARDQQGVGDRRRGQPGGDAAAVGAGIIPVPVSDDWSFVLDVLFCA